MARPVAIFLIVLLMAGTVHAEPLKNVLAKLTELPTPYGPTQLSVNGRQAVITRGENRLEKSVDLGDIYTVTVQDEDSWIIARRTDENTFNAVLFTTIPRYGWDSVTAVRFFIPADDTANSASALYALRAARPQFAVPHAPSIPSFELWRLNDSLDQDGDLYFTRVNAFTPKARYCNIEWAINQELGLPVRGKEPERYKCKN